MSNSADAHADKLYQRVNTDSAGDELVRLDLVTSETDALLEQYRHYVELADQLARRRQEANRFYVALLSGILTVIAVAAGWKSISEYQLVLAMFVGVTGIVLCAVWHLNIRSYRQLATSKYKVIHEMEQHLDLFRSYTREWYLLGGDNVKKYTQLTRLESAIPIVIAMMYVFLVAFSVWHLIR